MTRSTDITSFTDLRKNLRQRLDGVRASDRPLFVTTNGQTEAVVLSPHAYDELADRADLPAIVDMIRRSERDIAEGRVVDAHEGLTGLAAKHDLDLGR